MSFTYTFIYTLYIPAISWPTPGAADWMMPPAKITREDMLIVNLRPKVSANGAEKGAETKAANAKEDVICEDMFMNMNTYVCVYVHMKTSYELW
jgi:hypothetical protein